MSLNVLIPALISFSIGITITPIVTHFLYKHKVWKKEGGKVAIGGHEATEFNRLKGGDETKTPRMGGIIIWASVLITLGGTYVLGVVFPNTYFAELDYLSRSRAKSHPDCVVGKNGGGNRHGDTDLIGEHVDATALSLKKYLNGRLALN